MAAKIDLDAFLEETGQFGFSQAFIYFILSLSVYYSTIAAFSFAFTAGEIGYRCVIPECETDEPKYEAEWLYNATASKCKRYEFIGSGNNTYAGTCPKELFSTEKELSCDRFLFQEEDWTIMREWDIKCGKEWQLSLVGTINNIGQLFGFFTAGYCSDRFGRKRTLVVSTILTCTFGFLHYFSWNYYSFVTFEFITAFFVAGVFNSGFVLGVENVGKDFRVIGTVIICAFFCLGYVILAAFAMWVKSWKKLSFIYVPGFLCISYWWLLPESIRWLQTNGKQEELHKVLMTMSRMNRHKLTIEDLEERFSIEDETPIAVDGNTQEEKGHRIKNLLHSRILILRLLNCYVCWITNAFVYVGLSLASTSVGDFNKYVGFMLSGIIEIPAYIVTPILTMKCSRQKLLFISLVLSGAACTCYPFLYNDTVQLVFLLAAKFCISISYALIYVFTSELFPTNIRHSVMGTCSTIGRIGSITAPQWRELNKKVEGLPFYLFGAFSLTSGLLILLLPDTSKTKLPNTIEEAEQMGRKN